MYSFDLYIYTFKNITLADNDAQIKSYYKEEIDLPSTLPRG